MKQTRFLLAVVLCLAGLAPGGAFAQPVSVQRVGFSLLVDYQHDLTNAVATNAFIQDALVATGNVARAVKLEFGEDETNWSATALVREVNLTNGAEGLYLRGNGVQTNVSEFFSNALGASFTADFTSGTTNFFPALTNDFDPATPIYRGSIRVGAGGHTNYITTETFHAVAFNTSNMKFNLIGFGTASLHRVAGRMDGVIYAANIEQFTAQGLGTLYFNAGTNIFGTGTVPPITNSGVAHGTFWTGPPVFLVLTNGPGLTP